MTQFLIALTLFGQGVPYQGRGRQQPSAVIEIDGKKEPHRIPEYLVWEVGLRLLGRRTGLSPGGRRGLEHKIGLNQADREHAYAEADAHMLRETGCIARVKKREAELKADRWLPGAIRDETRVIVLDCRHQTLNAVDALMSKLSPEGQGLLRQWIESLKSGISIVMTEDDLPFFRLPR